MTRWLLSLLFTITLCTARERGQPPREGLGNFGKINDTLYRGAQPDAAGVKTLARLGIKSIINLRMANDVWNAEEAVARSSGITYTNVPLRGVGRPKHAQVAKLLTRLSLLKGAKGRKCLGIRLRVVKVCSHFPVLLSP